MTIASAGFYEQGQFAGIHWAMLIYINYCSSCRAFQPEPMLVPTPSSRLLKFTHLKQTAPCHGLCPPDHLHLLIYHFHHYSFLFPTCTDRVQWIYKKHRKADVSLLPGIWGKSKKFPMILQVASPASLWVTLLWNRLIVCDDWSREAASPAPLMKVALGATAGSRAAGGGNPVSPGQPADKP